MKHRAARLAAARADASAREEEEDRKRVRLRREQALLVPFLCP